jgi:hypothetical protein
MKIYHEIADENHQFSRQSKLPGTFSLQHQVGDTQLLKMFRLQIHKEIAESLTPSHPPQFRVCIYSMTT